MKESIEVYGSLDINLVPFKVRNTIHYIKDKSVQVVGHSHLEAIKLLTNNG